MIFEDLDKIIFAGDSVTDMGSSQPLGAGLFDSLGHGYVRMVENLLASCYPERRLWVVNAGTGGNTIDEGDDRLCNIVDALNYGTDLHDEATALLGGVEVVKRGKVAASGESTACTGEDDDADFIICLGGIEIVHDALYQIEAHGVETLGAIHGDDGHIAFLFIENCFVFCHFITSFHIELSINKHILHWI